MTYRRIALKTTAQFWAVIFLQKHIIPFKYPLLINANREFHVKMNNSKNRKNLFINIGFILNFGTVIAHK